MRLDNACKVISVFKAPPVRGKKFVQLANIVQLALTHPKTVLSAHSLTALAYGKRTNVPTVLQGHTALSLEGRTPQDNVELGFIVLLDPELIMRCHVLLASTVPQVRS